MTHIEIVQEAITYLNKNKDAGMYIHEIKYDSYGDVNVKVSYKEPIEGWDDKKNTYGFSKDWFKPEKVDLERYTYMQGFNVPSALRKQNPDAVCILRIAYYFYRRGVNAGVL